MSETAAAAPTIIPERLERVLSTDFALDNGNHDDPGADEGDALEAAPPAVAEVLAPVVPSSPFTLLWDNGDDYDHHRVRYVDPCDLPLERALAELALRDPRGYLVGIAREVEWRHPEEMERIKDLPPPMLWIDELLRYALDKLDAEAFVAAIDVAISDVHRISAIANQSDADAYSVIRAYTALDGATQIIAAARTRFPAHQFRDVPAECQALPPRPPAPDPGPGYATGPAGFGGGGGGGGGGGVVLLAPTVITVGRGGTDPTGGAA